MAVSRWKKIGLTIRRHLLTLLIFVSVVAGVGLGLALRSRAEPWSPRQVMYISFLGDVYLRMLKCLILPLITSSLIASLGQLDLRVSGKIGMRALVYYVTTTPCAVILGIILVVSIRPGEYGDTFSSKDETTVRRIETSTTEDAILDLVRNIFPENLVQACFEQHKTVLISPENGTQNETSIYDWKITATHSEGTNILGLITFAIVLGLAIGKLRERGKPVMAFFVSLFEAVMIIIQGVIWLAPIGILFLVAGKTMEVNNFVALMKQLGMYFVTVVVGLILHGFLVIPLIYFAATRKFPYRFLLNQSEALITAFATASSAATMPITIRCLEEKNNVHPMISRFVLPIGIINLEGTALYEAVAAIFIAQMRHIPLDFGKIVVISLTATAASMGAAGIPEAGLVTMVLVLNTVGLPATDVTVIILVDWLLDRCRTAVNVLGDSVAAGVVDHLSKSDLETMARQDPELGYSDSHSGFENVSSETTKV